MLIFPILTACVQEYLIYLELKKREKATAWHRAYWLYQLMVTIIMTVLVFVLGLDTSAVTIPVIKIAAMFCLLAYTTFVEEPPFDSDVPLVADSPTILGESTVR